ncbi:MAG: hypothetical protein V1789_11470 [PVC group bacterium]
MKFAWDKVPFYRKKYGSLGLHPNDIKSPDDFCKIPPVTRRELKENFSEMIAGGTRPNEMCVSTTGGSTGVPVKVLHDKRASVETYSWRMMNWWGIDPSMDGAFVWRMRRRGAIDRLVNVCAWYPTRKLRLDAASMTPRALDVFLRKFNQLQPPLLEGYVGSVHHLALYAEQNEITVHSPRAVWVTASPITAVQRQLIERIFRAPVYEEYGSAEVYWLAAQCRCREGLHINWEGRHIEFVDESGRPRPDGETGKILVTDLENYVFPIIRYENRDLGRALAGECPCGVRLPMMGPVRGRTTDMIKLPDGTAVSGAYLTTIFDDFPDAVKSFRIIQKADYSLLLKYVPGLPPSDLSPLLEKVRAELVRRTKNQIPLVMEPVEDITHDGGKLNFVASEVARRCSLTDAEQAG